jgi:hypothetical protein
MTQPSGPHDYFRLLAAAAIDGEVTPGEMLELRAHLATCAACRADEQAMRRDNAWLATTEAVLPPRRAVRETMLRAAERRHARIGGLGRVAAAVATVVLAVGAAWWLGFGRVPLVPGAASHAPSSLPTPPSGRACSGSPFGPPVSIPTTSAGTVPWSLASADMNADGLLDLVVLSVEPGTVGIMLGDGRGAFSQPRPTTPADPNPLAGSEEPTLVVADITNDGRADVITSNVNGTVTVFVRGGTGDLGDAIVIQLDGKPRQIGVGQLSGDGNLDLAVADESGFVRVLVGDGSGAFVSAEPVELGGSPRGIAAGDLDGDGDTDLFVSNESDYGATVLRGTGNGAFAPPLLLDALAATHVNLVDIDRDGDLDALLANSGPDSVSVLLGDGAGSFGAPQVLALPGGAPGVAQTLDIDADGDVDLVANDGVSNDLAIFLGDGHGVFQLLERMPAAGGPTGLVVGDFDRDGRPDLATSNANGNSVSIFSNRCGVAEG